MDDANALALIAAVMGCLPGRADSTVDQDIDLAVERRPEWDAAGLRATFAFVKMACDRCDTPWKSVVDEPGETPGQA